MSVCVGGFMCVIVCVCECVCVWVGLFSFLSPMPHFRLKNNFARYFRRVIVSFFFIYSNMLGIFLRGP